MSSGERPIGAAKSKQSDTEALCQPPPPPYKYNSKRTENDGKNTSCRSDRSVVHAHLEKTQVVIAKQSIIEVHTCLWRRGGGGVAGQ